MINSKSIDINVSKDFINNIYIEEVGDSYIYRYNKTSYRYPYYKNNNSQLILSKDGETIRNLSCDNIPWLNGNLKIVQENNIGIFGKDIYMVCNNTLPYTKATQTEFNILSDSSYIGTDMHQIGLKKHNNVILNGIIRENGITELEPLYNSIVALGYGIFMVSKDIDGKEYKNIYATSIKYDPTINGRFIYNDKVVKNAYVMCNELPIIRISFINGAESYIYKGSVIEPNLNNISKYFEMYTNSQVNNIIKIIENNNCAYITSNFQSVRKQTIEVAESYEWKRL